MSTLLDLDFASDVSAFTGGAPAWSSAEGADFTNGVASFTTSNTGNRAVLTFEEQSTGRTIVSFWYKCTDTATGSNSTALDDFIYLFPAATDPNLGASATGATALCFSRNTANGATGAMTMLQHRNSSGFQNLFLHVRSQWYRVAIDINHATDQYDVYVDGRLVSKNQTVANASSGTVGQIVFLHQSGSTTTLFDDIRVYSTPTGYDASTNLILSMDYTTSINGEIETLYPDVDYRSIYPQPHKIPDSSTFGAFTVNSNGAVPDSNKQCGALLRGTAEGRVKLYCRAASSGNIGASIIDRVWAGFDDDSYLELRYSKAATGAELRLYQGTTALTAGLTPDDNASVTAGTDYTIRMDRRGRVIDCYFNDIFEFSFTISAGAGNRGQLSEEHVGFYIDTRAANLNLSTTNYVRRLEVYADEPLPTLAASSADLPPVSERISAGGITYEIEAEGILAAYASDYESPTRNLGWSKLFQFAHLSAADPNKQGSRYKLLYSGNNVRSFLIETHNMREDVYLGYGAYAYCTVTPRGVWVREGMDYYNAAGASDYAPDNDFRTELWSDVISHSRRSAAGVINQGSVTKGFGPWEEIFPGNDGGIFQVVTNNGSGNKVLATAYCGQLGGNIGDNLMYLSSKRLGCLDPMSLAFTVSRNSISNGNALASSRLLMLDVGASVATSHPFQADILDDLEEPAALTVSVGSGGAFSQTYGWYDLTASNNAVSFAFDGVYDRVRPQFHIADLPNVASVTVDGVAQTLNTDYWVTDDGDGGVVVGFTGTLADDASIAISGTGGPSLVEWNRLLRARNIGSATDTDSAYEKLRRNLLGGAR